MEWVPGLFALAGVALAGVMSEIRARREARAQAVRELAQLKRDVYSRALKQVEAVASRVAQWSLGGPDTDEKNRRLFWDDLTGAYQVLNEVRLVAGSLTVADRMYEILREYRAVIEQNERRLPNTNATRKVMIEAFRADLGMPHSPWVADDSQGG